MSMFENMEVARPAVVIDWRTVDHALRTIASRRAALDAEEARWLREAEALQIWKPLGMVSALDYLERVLHYAPRTAQDRLRVARALGDLPRLGAAFASGRFGFSAVRELTRVMTPSTESAWLDAAAGKTLRELEDMVAHRKPGDGPDDPPDPEPRMHIVRFELAAETFALMRQARCALNDEHGTNLSDDELVAAMCSAVLDGTPTSEPTGRAKFQIALTVCERCNQGWQEGAGAQIPISREAVERALCDAQHIGSVDGDMPERAYQDIPPSVVRFVWRRDDGRCRVPGCRSARGLEVHHIIHRADGGGHEPSGLVLLCGSCHRAHHAGLLAISGTADALVVRRPHEPAVGPPGRSPAPGAHVGAEVEPHTGEQPLENVPASASADPRVQLPPFAVAPGAPEGAQSERPAENVPANTCAGASGRRPPAATRAIVVGAETERPPENLPGNASADATGQLPPIAIAPGAHVGAAHVSGGNGPAARDVRTNPPVRMPSKLDRAILQTQAKAALTSLGWKPAIAVAAVTAACAAQGAELTLEGLIRESLRRCPVPKA